MVLSRWERRGSANGVVGRAMVLLMTLALVCGLVPALGAQARAESWMDEYLETLVDWGVMRGNPSGELNGDKEITRAELAAMINRAFGHTEVGVTPFSDVPQEAWYAEDIGIAYKAGYFNGTTATTASPDSPVTREQAAVMIGRNLRLQGGAGETLGFEDSRDMGIWSRGIVQEATDLGIITGYSDGTFRPKENVLRGQVAAMLVRAVGTLVREPGEWSPGNVYGNLTVNTSGVKLKDSVIAGNLYLSGGVGLGDVQLENVTVLGRIVVSGGGQSEKGDNSVLLRNVAADELVVDSLSGQFLSLSAEGLTEVDTATVRTNAYLEDLTGDGLGLSLIQLDGGAGSQLQLAGNIKEVVNLTPASILSFAQGVADRVTVDEEAVGSTVNIANGVNLQELNLDVASTVIGRGDVDHLNVSANGAVVDMLPTTITVRPGVTANVYGETMDTTTAAESSQDPRLLAGYPKARNLAPKTADAVFSTNKRGTIYWALTALADGSVGEETLLNPSSYSGKVIKSGTLNAAESNTEYTTKLSGLTADGSYYISAMMVDNRGMYSPVKVTAFTTPDDTTPAFASGYPTVSFADYDDKIVVQSEVMANKDCRLYWALLPKGSTAPKAADFKAASVSGNLGYGILDVEKNDPVLIDSVNTATLAEQTSYDLYMWLTDVDGAKSSAVKKLSVTTPDRTPPVLQHLTVSDATAKNVKFTYSLSEPGTLYWAAVKKDVPFYTKTSDGRIPDATELAAMVQVENGVGALKKGSSNASKASTDATFNISGLEAQTAYDLYYVVKDKAGNYGVYPADRLPPVRFSTLDSEPPTVEQVFTHDGTSDDSELTPYPDTSIRLVFSESVQGIKDDGAGGLIYQAFEELSGTELANALADHIRLYYVPASGAPEQVPAREVDSQTDWVIDYRKATVSTDRTGTGEMTITFPYNAVSSQSALNLSSGATYYFELEGIADISTAANRMEGKRGVTTLQEFTTIDAQMVFSRGSATGMAEDGVTPLTFDMNFRLTPVTATSVKDEVVWDLLFFSSNPMCFQLYYKDKSEDYWTLLQADTSEAEFKTTSMTPTVGISIARELQSGVSEKGNPNFARLNTMDEDREYGIIVTQWGTSTDRSEWSCTASITVIPVSGDQGSMSVLANSNLTPEIYDDHQAGIYKVREIGVPAEYTVSCPFRDTTPPTFVDGYPIFEPGDSGVNMSILLSRENTSYYYVVTEVGNIPTILTNGTSITKNNWTLLPEDGTEYDERRDGNVTAPGSDSIVNPKFNNEELFKTGNGKYTGGRKTISIEEGLKAETQYVAYFVLQGESAESISDVYAFRFETSKVTRPVLTVSLSNPTAYVTSDREADVKYLLLVSGQEGETLKAKMEHCWNGAAASQYDLDSATTTKYQSMTVLEAMEAAYAVGGTTLGSVFDLFASEVVQDSVSTWFNAASTNGSTIMKVGDLSLTTRNKLTDEVNCKNDMPPGKQEYWFVAMGQSPLGSGYAFSAARYLFYPDTAHPMVITLGSSTDTNVTNDYGVARNTAYSGTLTIVFDNYLYYKQGTKYLQVVDKPMSALISSTEYVSSASLLTSYKVQIIPQVKATSQDNPLCSTLILEYNAVKPGETISFDQNLANSRGITGNNALALKMQLVEDKEGYWIPEFYISSEGWDATTR